MFPTVAFLIKAGVIKEEDDLLPIIQGFSFQQMELVADWLALATGGAVVVRFITAEFDVSDIERDASDVQICHLNVDQPPS